VRIERLTRARARAPFAAVLLAALGAAPWSGAQAPAPPSLSIVRGPAAAAIPILDRDGDRWVPLGTELKAALEPDFRIAVRLPFVTLTWRTGGRERSLLLAVGSRQGRRGAQSVWLPDPARLAGGVVALTPRSCACALALLGARARWDSSAGSLRVDPEAAAPPAPAPVAQRPPVSVQPPAPRPAVRAHWPLHIVVDAGHGGHDAGASGPTGLYEKDVTLDIARRLARLLEARGATVTMTRDADRFISLKERVRIAARVEADVFVSVHANSSPSDDARGVETYVYGQRTTSGHINDVVRRENADSNYLDIMLNDLAQLQFHDRSVDMAGSVEKKLIQQLGVTGRAHRKIMQAPFYVLARAERPAILIEVGFMSNPREERQLRDPEYRRQLAESIAAGLFSTFGAS